MTVVQGRNRFADAAVTRIVVRDSRGTTDLLTIEGGYLEPRHDGFLIAAKHPTATDEEGDSAYVAYLEGYGLAWDGMMGSTQSFKGAIMSAKYIEADAAAEELEAQGHLSFTPADRRWKPGVYSISVEIAD